MSSSIGFAGDKLDVPRASLNDVPRYVKVQPKGARSACILAEGAMTLPVTLSGGVLFAS